MKITKEYINQLKQRAAECDFKQPIPHLKKEKHNDPNSQMGFKKRLSNWKRQLEVKEQS